MKISQILSLFSSLILFSNYSYAQNKCEEITSVSLPQLITLLKKNDYNRIQTSLNTLNASCGETELIQRTRIIYQIINKENTDGSIKQYLQHKYDEKLTVRWDFNYEENQVQLFKENKAYFEYIPLNHPVDSLLQLKAKAILLSNAYGHLNKNEEALLYLFADDIDKYYSLLDKAKPSNKLPPSKVDKIYEQEYYKDKHTFAVHLGAFTPIGNNDFFSRSVTFGASVMSSFENNFVGELSYKARIHPDANPFDFKYKETIRSVKAKSSHAISLGVGYKVLDNNGYIILPKFNLGYGFIWTGLSETEFVEDEEGNEDEIRRYRNVNTMHSGIGIAFIKHLRKKTYIGIEPIFHLVPYKWHSKLKSSIPSTYASLELFLRF